MAGSVNKVVIVGNLGKDPEVRTTQDGSKIVNLTVATSDVWNDRSSGERRERTEWHRVVIFNDRLGDVAERFLRKGSKAYIEGALQTRKWTDQQGQDRYTTEVVLAKFRGELVLLDTRGGGENGGDAPRGEDQHSRGSGYGGQGGGRSSSGGRSGGAARGGDAWGGGGGSWGPSSGGSQAPGGDLDDEIPFAPCWM
jgi:single-strand DNA-binding protein